MAAVTSRNFFDVLREDPTTAPAVTPEPAEKPKIDAPPSRGTQKGRSGPASRGGRYYQRGGGAASTPREPADAEDLPQGKRSGDERGRGRGRGGRGRGERGRGGHGRVFDKHSATGKVDSEKKINQGWGADEGNKELKAEEEGSKDAAAETPADNPWAVDVTATTGADDAWGAAVVDTSGDAAKDGAPAEVHRAKEEEEDKTLTLDEFRAQQREKDTVPKLDSVRKANDGNANLFKDAIQVTKDAEEAVYYAAKPKSARQRGKKDDKKQANDIFFNGQYSDRVLRGGRGGRGGDRGGDRGARGGARGRGGRGRGRGDFHDANNQTVKIDNQADFPSLNLQS